METRIATTVEEFIAIMAANTPNGAVLDWWLRVDLALHEYAEWLVPPVDADNRNSLEGAVARDEELGPAVAASLHDLRQIRNRVAHEKNSYITTDKAVAYGRESFRLLGILGKRISRGGCQAPAGDAATAPDPKGDLTHTLSHPLRNSRTS